MRKSIAIDMDNVIVDIETNWIEWYDREFGIRITKEAMQGIPEDAAFPDPVSARSVIHKTGFFRYAPMIAGAAEAIKKLHANYDIFIVSAAMEFPNSLLEKHDWIMEHLPFITWKNIVLCGDKSVIRTDYMIDDHLKNLDFFKGKTLLFTAGHNILVDRHKRVNNWDEVLQFFDTQRETVS